MRDRTNDVEIERDVKVTMPDDVVLLTDVYHPVGVGDAPTILERTPYGRAGVATMAGPELAARGYRYVLQACRGTDGSGGSHSYFAEAPDGRATADWIAEQPWFDGRLGSYGASYMGFTQWALASTRPPHLKAMAVALSTSIRNFSWFPGDSLALEVIIPWDLGAVQFNKPDNTGIVTDVSPEAVARRMAELRAAFDHLPLGDVIRHVTGEDLPLYRDQLEHARADDPFWAPLNFRTLLSEWTVPTLLVDGWHDYPLPGVCDDYAALRATPAPVRLRIGAGGHLGGGGEGGMTDAPLEWFDTYLLERPDLLPSPTLPAQWAAHPVTVQVQGEGGEWRDLDDWPPPSSAPTAWYLHPGGRLSTAAPTAPSEPDRYRYDPADPTPSIGGIGMLTGGALDNRELEARARRARVHERAARRAARAHRSGRRGAVRQLEPRPHRLLRAGVRRRSRRPLGQRVRRAPALRAVDDRPRRRRRVPRHRSRLARRSPIRRRSPPPRAGVERRAPGVRAQLRDR